jgi:hypothetical protein
MLTHCFDPDQGARTPAQSILPTLVLERSGCD